MNRPATTELTAAEVTLRWLSSAVAGVVGTGRLGLLFTVLGAAAGVAVALLSPKQYTSSTSFIARGTSASVLPAALQGLALSVGLGSSRDYSPQFYADLLTSRPVLTSVLNRDFAWAVGDADTSATYAEIERIRSEDSALVQEAALRRLIKRIQTRADPRTNIISLGVAARSPRLSRDLTVALLQALDSMNISFRQEQSRELRQFFEARVATAQRELGDAETALRSFLERNRSTDASPLLQFEQVRLSREVELKRTVYVTVVQQYEEAKLQESRNVPILTVLSPPSLPVKKSAPPRKLIVVVGALIGFCVVPLTRGLRRILQRILRDQMQALGASGDGLRTPKPG